MKGDPRALKPENLRLWLSTYLHIPLGSPEISAALKWYT
jgi:hypothetical protein